MIDVGPAVKITIHLNEDISSRTDFLHNEILGFLYKQGVSGATVIPTPCRIWIPSSCTYGGSWRSGGRAPSSANRVHREQANDREPPA